MNTQKLIDLIKTYPEWVDELDETACPNGSVICPICFGGGSLDGRRKRPITHKDDCPRKEFNEWLKK